MRRFHGERPAPVEPMYAGIHSVLVGLTLTALALGPRDAAAQRPEQLPPTPRVEVKGPVGPPPAPAQLTSADVSSWLDGFLPYALQSGDIAGAVVVVVKNGDVL